MRIKTRSRTTFKLDEKETEAFTELLRYLWNEVEIEESTDAGEAGVELVRSLLKTLSPASV